MKKKTYEIGDWVMSKAGKIHRIYADDMPELPYEDIERLLSPEEVPVFKFPRNPVSLNKGNFWDEALLKCPNSVGDFIKWIDWYKTKVGWQYLTEKKFNDLPFEMQIGIIHYYFDYKGVYNTIVIRPDMFFSETGSYITSAVTSIADAFVRYEVFLYNSSDYQRTRRIYRKQ